MSSAGEFPDYGYDPTLDAGLEGPPPLTEADLPSSAKVNSQYLPPVGEQGTTQHMGAPATCAAWASTYGLATFTAAKRGDSPPTSNELIASPAYIYLQVRQQMTKPTPPCKGSSFKYYFNLLAGQGTPNLAAAPYFSDCLQLTQYYQGKQIAPDSRFALKQVSHVQTSDLLRIKQLLVSNCALAYGTRLYTDFGQYKGVPSPYVGNGKIAYAANGNPVGHCMLIIGYDDESGAFLIQNSEGTSWGADGYVWMAYETFSALAQGIAFYYED